MSTVFNYLQQSGNYYPDCNKKYTEEHLLIYILALVLGG